VTARRLRELPPSIIAPESAEEIAELQRIGTTDPVMLCLLRIAKLEARLRRLEARDGPRERLEGRDDSKAGPKW
jgi:hypothetical protein